MNIEIRQEQLADFIKVEDLIRLAFENEEYSDHTEHELVRRLRSSDAFVPELSLVALSADKIIGHILLTKITISGKDVGALALAPVAVAHDFQKQGIGRKLIEKSHQLAKSLGYKSVLLLGHADYYPRFGYKLLSNYGIRLPFDVPAENCMAIELVDEALHNLAGGVVEYAKEF